MRCHFGVNIPQRYCSVTMMTTQRRDDDGREKRAGLRIPAEMNAYLIQEAKNQGISKNALILQILWKWTKERDVEAV